MAEHADLKYDYKHRYVLGAIHFFFSVLFEDLWDYVSSQHAASTMSELAGTLSTLPLERITILKNKNMIIQEYLLSE